MLIPLFDPDSDTDPDVSGNRNPDHPFCSLSAAHHRNRLRASPFGFSSSSFVVKNFVPEIQTTKHAKCTKSSAPRFVWFERFVVSNSSISTCPA